MSSVKTTIETGVHAALEPGDYRDFTGYVNIGGTEGYAENATFMLSDKMRKFDSGLAPEWMTTMFTIVWHKGDWLGGTFNDGAFYGGVFHDGLFLKSCFHGRGLFQDGVFRKSMFYNGVWVNGDWDRSVWLFGNVLLDNVNRQTSYGPGDEEFRPAFRTIVEDDD